MKKYNPMGNYNPLKEVDKLVKQAHKLSTCKCGNRKLPESDFCKECI